MVKIPLELLNLQDDGFHLLVEVIVFNQKFKAVLDTGASKTVLDKATLERHLGTAGLTLTDKVSTGLGTTSMESYSCSLTDFQIGDFHLQQVEIAVLDLSSINYAYQNLSVEPVIGVIGGDILHLHHGVIDYGRQTLTLKKRHASQRAFPIFNQT